MGSTSASSPEPVRVLVIGANGYLGSAISRAFLRAAMLRSFYFQVYGLVRRASTARALAIEEVIPIVGSISDTRSVSQAILSHSRTWDVIVNCTEPSKSNPVAEAQHWDEVLVLVQGLAEASASAPRGKPVYPLVLWSSGCKDYGTTKLHGDPRLKEHSETSPLNPHKVVRCRMEGALRALAVAGKNEGRVAFDVAVVRATPVFGYSGSYYGVGFEYAAAFAAALASEKNKGATAKVLKFTADADTILHGIHVDDCADGYVALARMALFEDNDVGDVSGNCTQKRGRAAIAGQVFNISGRRYVTLQEVGAALAAEYGFTGDTQFGVSADNIPETIDVQGLDLVFGYSQWVNSEKIRALTGWSDKRPLISENMHAYRLAYEAARDLGCENIERIRERMMGDEWN
ncbi:hypothetical protein EPUS_08550 [Endocarpon pusillum Z07020]|uniref:NAD-dependent epimerase/dehydratase domain-containing protein n=1 Tax=Endocarpon pusillum (strain Z07020 / HMAS-L-300199) TaxID=1263415 RepID=U1G7K3_ENDPU|nr:uncharacterized protein EPUS_08550 [Endocarpon pusillum Z07020]ERF73407.1 hypothetical protein EPUS_08550 [Endocarpon pusillum Z07020]